MGYEYPMEPVVLSGLGRDIETKSLKMPPPPPLTFDVALFVVFFELSVAVLSGFVWSVVGVSFAGEAVVSSGVTGEAEGVVEICEESVGGAGAVLSSADGAGAFKPALAEESGEAVASELTSWAGLLEPDAAVSSAKAAATGWMANKKANNKTVNFLKKTMRLPNGPLGVRQKFTPNGEFINFIFNFYIFMITPA